MNKVEEKVLLNRFGDNICERSGRFNDYIFSYGLPGCIFTAPRYLISNTGKEIDVKRLREKQIEKDSTNHALGAIKVEINKLGLQVIEEAVIPIDRQVWEECCRRHGISKEFLETHVFDTPESKKVYTSHFYKTHLRLDWIFPALGFNLEHDGSSYHVKILDNIRDDYLRTIFPNLQIVRIENFNPKSKKKVKELQDIFQNLPDPLDTPLILRYEDLVIRSLSKPYICDET